MNFGKLVKITWEDAHSNTGTISKEDLGKEKFTLSDAIGYKVYEDEKKVVICGFIFYEDGCKESEVGYKYSHHIPKGMIRKEVELVELKAVNKVFNS